MIQIDQVLVRFGGVVALNAVSAAFTAPVGGIIGPNGAGKTTLMNVISGFITPKDGRVMVEDRDILSLPPHKRAHLGLRRSFQKEQIADDLTVFENVLVQLDHRLGNSASKRAEVARMLDVVGLADHADTPGAALSGFERRLTDVARCLVGDPKLILFDEPAGGMSVEETHRLGDLILGIHALTGAQTLVIDHDVELISRICTQTLVLDFGRAIAFGPTAEVLSDPRVKAAYLGTEEIADPHRHQPLRHRPQPDAFVQCQPVRHAGSGHRRHRREWCWQIRTGAGPGRCAADQRGRHHA